MKQDLLLTQEIWRLIKVMSSKENFTPDGVGLPFHGLGSPEPLAWNRLVPRSFFERCRIYIKSEMQRLLEIARGKLDNLNIPLNKEFSIIPQLMLSVFNEETPDDLDLNMSDRDEMEQELIALLKYSDKVVKVMLGLQDKERLNEITEQLEEAQTEDQIREVLIADHLYEAMKQNSDHFPYHKRVGL